MSADRSHPRAAQGDLRCAYCHDALGETQAACACAGCGTWLHPGCLEEVVACPVLGCGVSLGPATKGTATDTEHYTRVLDNAIGVPLRWSVRIAVAVSLALGLLPALQASTWLETLAGLVLCVMSGALIGVLIGGLIGGVRERRAFGEGWRD